MFSKKLFNNNQNSSGGGTGGPTNWGSIGGNIDNQTDLKNKLADKASKSELPAIATNNNVGLVKPDGTSITITNDGTISSVGGGGTDTNFVPAGTILTVKTDGSGQFTQLSEAINYLTGKWSNGTVTIQLGEGDFVEENTIDIPEFNIKTLQITGQGVDKTSISCSNTKDYNYVITNTVANIRIANLLLKGNINYKLRGLYANLNGSYLLENVNLYNFERGSLFVDSAKAYLKGTLNIGSTSTAKVVDTGIQAINGGIISIQSGATINFKKCDGALYCNGGIISSYPNAQVTYSEVTTFKINPNNGLWMGGIS